MRNRNTIEYMGIVVKKGRGGGTYAHKDVAFRFVAWSSVKFELYIVKDYQRPNCIEETLTYWAFPGEY